MYKQVGICFSKDKAIKDPLSHVGRKLPVYIELLDRINAEGWQAYVLTRKTYLGDGKFKGAWRFSEGRLKWIKDILNLNLAYDKTGGLVFPPPNDSLRVVNNRSFNEFCCDKWQAYKVYGRYMPATFWVGEKINLDRVLSKVNFRNVVLKPYNGLKGYGIFIGKIEDVRLFNFSTKYPKYILQEFVETRKGIPEIVSGRHDLRVVVINKKIVWSHVRIPPMDSLKANVAGGGSLKEVDPEILPDKVVNIVNLIARDFYGKYDNPVFSVDFGINEKGDPKIFEFNDQIGFPLPDMKNKDKFLSELILNFKSKLLSPWR